MNRKIFTVIAIVATVLFAATNIDTLEAHQVDASPQLKLGDSNYHINR